MESAFQKIELSSQKVAYSRANNPESSIVVRSLYPNYESGARFSLGDVLEIRSLYLSLLVLINTNIDILKKFEKTALLTIAKRGENFVKNYEVKFSKKKEDPDHRGFYYIDIELNGKKTLRVGLNFSIQKGQSFSLRVYKNEEEAKLFQYGVFLFASEVKKLINYINKRFKFESDHLSENCGRDDDFF